MPVLGNKRQETNKKHKKYAVFLKSNYLVKFPSKQGRADKTKDSLEYLRVITFFSKHFNKWFPGNIIRSSGTPTSNHKISSFQKNDQKC